MNIYEYMIIYEYITNRIYIYMQTLIVTHIIYSFLLITIKIELHH